jgi:anti-sigma factor RsiW
VVGGFAANRHDTKHPFVAMSTSQSVSYQLPERDLELLSAYLDQQLTPAEQLEVEQRLRDEPELRTEYETLRATVTFYRELESIEPPRSFTLDPASAPRRGWFAQFQRLAFLQLGSGLAGLILVLLVGFQFLAQPVGSTFGGIGAGLDSTEPEAAMAPMATPAPTAAANLVRPEATAALAEAAEAPAEPLVAAPDLEMVGADDEAAADAAFSEGAGDTAQAQAAGEAPGLDPTVPVAGGASDMTAMETRETTSPAARSEVRDGSNLWLLVVGLLLLGLGFGSFIYGRRRRV